MLLKKYILPGLLLLLSFLVLICFYRFTTNPYLTFSDGAKFADIGRNLVSSLGYGTNFTRLGSDLQINSKGLFSATLISPLTPFFNAASFKLFGVSDLSVIAISSFFYLFLVFTTYLLGKKLFGYLVGLLAGMTVAFNLNFLDYATSGASETLFVFEIVLASYLFILKKKKLDIFGFGVLVLMYLTRPQAIIYIFGLIFLYLLLNFPIKKAIKYAFFIFFLGSGLYLAISKQGLFAITQHLPGVAQSVALRGGVQEASILELIKKTSYNLYNFYRLLTQIASPYMWGLFLIGLVVWTKDRLQNSLKIATIFMVVLTFLVTALTIPFFRYLHPVVPLVYLIAVSTLVGIIRSTVNGKRSMVKKYLPRLVSKDIFIILSSSFLILFFVVGQTLGVIFLDSRFEAKRINKDKPPVYVRLSWLLRDITEPDDVIVTNLDTWGSWYGERRTIWFPLKPEQLSGFEDKIDAIYLTSYLIDDENYYMGQSWREIYNSPQMYGNDFLTENYELKGVYEIDAKDTYERQEARAILLVKKTY